MLLVVSIFITAKVNSPSRRSDSESVGNASNELQLIAEGISDVPVILEKFQVPNIKQRKDEAIAILKKYEETIGKPLDVQFIKKNSMKTRLKKETDLKKTGNKLIKLSDREKQLLKALQGDSNPTIGRTGGAMQIGTDANISTEQRGREASIKRRVSDVSFQQSGNSVTAGTLAKRKQIETAKYETDKTRGLTTKELQRLVPLHHTSVVQKEYYQKKLDIINRKETTKTSVVDENRTYVNLKNFTKTYYLDCF